MCSRDCSEDEAVCPEGFTCGDLSGGRYCLQGCVADEGCRDGMICVVGQCRLAVGWDRPCEENADCESGICHEGRCNLECHAAGACPEGLSCIDPGSGVPVCLVHNPPPSGPGTSGENCTFDECAADHICVSRTDRPANDPNAYCSRSCGSELDCPADMTCRGTQLNFESDPILRCVPREYCERCSYDTQCGIEGDLCVSRDPLRGAGRHCSRSCDPEREGTCPTDSTCREALWCAADRAWVADCEWCSDEEACGAAEDGPVHQCFHDYGACEGDGSEYCAPCYVDADCPEGGICNFDQYTANNYCTMPCPEEEGVYRCPPEHSCFMIEGIDDPQCLPRQGSCSHPSGGITTCFVCEGMGDCISGQCLPWNLTPGYPMVCWEDCPGGDADCPDFTVCHPLSDGSGNTFNLCGPPEGWTCVRVQICQEECPDGPGECPSDARSECRGYRP
jgi:hypothetical protein